VITKTKQVLFLILLLPASVFALDDEAERYVKLALEFGQYDRDYVDAYLGPDEWAKAAKENLRSKDELGMAISSLYSDLKQLSPTDPEEIRRYRSLLRNMRAMDTRMRMINGETFSFAEEARLLYDVTVPDYDLAEFDRVLEKIDALLPGEGSLPDRVDAFRSGLVIPDATREAVIARAVDECKKRTLKHISLPSTERYTMEYVTGKSWSGYNWYQGDNESLMQINLDSPPKIDSAITLGCHEGYPGHHVWNVLVENKLLKENGWIEFSVFPLFSPAGLIGEGSGNYGVPLAFPGDEKIEFERDVLFPLAGLDPDKAAVLDKLNALSARLSHASTATAQLYLDGKITRDDAIDQRQKYGLTSRTRAEQSVRFIEQYRSYVLNYSLGQDIVREYIESQGDDQDARWEAFERMLTELSYASDMTD